MQCWTPLLRAVALALLLQQCATATAAAQKIVLTNDDGWVVAQIRAQYDALVASGFDVSPLTFARTRSSPPRPRPAPPCATGRLTTRV